MGSKHHSEQVVKRESTIGSFYTHAEQQAEKQKQAALAENTAPTAAVQHKEERIAQRAKPMTGCDTLFLKNGTVIAARVIEVNDEEVEYRNCTGSDQVKKYISLDEIHHITSSTGKVSTFENRSDSELESDPASGQGKINTLALVGLILVTLFFPLLFLAAVATSGALGAGLALVAVLLFLFGVILSIIGLVQITRAGSGEKGKWMALAALILAGITIVMAVIGLL